MALRLRAARTEEGENEAVWCRTFKSESFFLKEPSEPCATSFDKNREQDVVVDNDDPHAFVDAGSIPEEVAVVDGQESQDVDKGGAVSGGGQKELR